MGQAKILNAVGSIGGVAAAASKLAGALGGSLPGGWKASLRQASYRGVPFGVLAGEVTFGRKNAVHRYPKRDGVWVEDMGREARLYHLTAFLVEDSAVYGGGGVVGQRDRLIRAFETAGDGELVHPTLGRMKVSALEGHSLERWDTGRYFELTLVFIEAGERRFPTNGTSTGDALSAAANSLNAASVLSFAKQIASAVKLGAAVVQQAVSTALGWYVTAVGLVHDVKRFFGAVSTLAGNFGNLFGGGNSGYSAAAKKVKQSTTVGDLIRNDAAARTAVTQAGNALVAAAGQVSDTATFGAKAQGLAAALAASAVDPADRIRLLLSLGSYEPDSANTSSAIGVAMATMQSACADLFRRCAVSQLIVAVGAFQPRSADEASAMAATVSDVLAAAALRAGDQGEDDVYLQLMAANKAVVADLKARGGNLAAVADFSFADSLPALMLAQRMYRDPSRSDDLIVQADAVHPAFMPTKFKALAS